MPYNLDSPNRLLEPCDIAQIRSWYERQTLLVEVPSVRAVLRLVGTNLEDFVHWPKRALLLWQDCDRVPLPGKKLKYHAYPEKVRVHAKKQGVILDTRPNGPAIAAFRLAGGDRPARFGSSNAWSIHHLYSGKFFYTGLTSTLHAAKDRNHFTQSAGLVATHPIADALSDEFPFFAWMLRAEAFQRFAYDPDGVFSATQNELGFADNPGCDIICEASESLMGDCR